VKATSERTSERTNERTSDDLSQQGCSSLCFACLAFLIACHGRVFCSACLFTAFKRKKR
jgi:hypothetical protein